MRIRTAGGLGLDRATCPPDSEGRPIADVDRGTVDRQQIPLLKSSQQARYRFAAHADHLFKLLLSERDPKTILTVSAIGRPAKEKSRQFVECRTRKPQGG